MRESGSMRKLQFVFAVVIGFIIGSLLVLFLAGCSTVPDGQGKTITLPDPQMRYSDPPAKPNK